MSRNLLRLPFDTDNHSLLANSHLTLSQPLVFVPVAFCLWRSYRHAGTVMGLRAALRTITFDEIGDALLLLRDLAGSQFVLIAAGAWCDDDFRAARSTTPFAPI